jgi:hypothetical protein
MFDPVIANPCSFAALQPPFLMTSIWAGENGALSRNSWKPRFSGLSEGRPFGLALARLGFWGGPQV